jgi:pimeloyl-ACP methyl ester carboxylesterase
MGMSFAGGLSLITAADPRYADDIGMVVAVGAHHDLGRVSRFFATSRVELPDGSSEALAAHDYGALVLVYGHIEGFFAKEDAEAAREALRLWLWEQPDRAREAAKALSPEGRGRMDALFDRRVDAIAQDLITQIGLRGSEMALVSPSGQLSGIKARTFLLHGAGDTVIPASETLWLASEVPAEALEEALVSKAVAHVELDGAPPFTEKLALVRFMTRVLEVAGAGAGSANWPSR